MRFEDIKKGMAVTFDWQVRPEHVQQFAALTGDTNPLHIDPDVGAVSPFGQNIAHGMLAASLFSTLVGVHCPGSHSVYLSQTLQFRNPIFVGDTLTVRGTVLHVSDSVRLVLLKTEIIKNNQIAIDGEAQVKLLSYES